MGAAQRHRRSREAPRAGADDLPGRCPRRPGRFLTTWGTRYFTLADASLRHAFPAQHAYLFQGGLKMQQGNGGVLAVSTFLDRLDGLVADPARKDTRGEDEGCRGRGRAGGG